MGTAALGCPGGPGLSGRRFFFRPRDARVTTPSVPAASTLVGAGPAFPSDSIPCRALCDRLGILTFLLPSFSTAFPNKFPIPVTNNLYREISTGQIGTMHERTPKNSNPTPAPNSTSASLSPEQTAPIPKTGTTSTPATRIKSFVRTILLASPAFPRLYADVVISSAPNSNEAKILARNYQKIVDRTNLDRTNRTNMPIRTNVRVCTHIKVTGVRCGSPTLRGEQFCYFHQRMIRTSKARTRVSITSPSSRTRKPSRPPSWRSSTP